MAFDDTRSTTERPEHVIDEKAEGIDSAPHAEVRRQGSFGDSDLPEESVEVDTDLKGSFGQIDRTPGTAGDDPRAGMIDTAAAGGMQGSFGDVDETGGPVDTSEKGSYGELDKPSGLERAEDDAQRYDRNG